MIYPTDRGISFRGDDAQLAFDFLFDYYKLLDNIPPPRRQAPPGLDPATIRKAMRGANGRLRDRTSRAPLAQS